MKAEKNWANYEMEDKLYKECNQLFNVTNKQFNPL